MRNSRHGDLRTLMTSRRNGNILWLAKHSGILFTSPLIITIASPHIALDSCYPTFLLKKKELEQARQPYLFCARNKIILCVAKARVMIDVSTLSENGLPQRHAVGTFDVCLARPKNCPTDTVRPHATQLMIDTTVDHFCLFWPSA